VESTSSNPKWYKEKIIIQTTPSFPHSKFMGFPTSINHLFLLIFSSFCLGAISANDTITSTRFISDSDSQITSSSNGDFKVGFFSPENSTNRYVAIWYLSQTNIIWVGNRDEPLKDSSGVFKIHEDGNLVVLNGENSVIWSTNVSVGGTNTSAQLDNSGNLILRGDSSLTPLWDSFTHPADIAVPQMKIATNRITGKPWFTIYTFIYYSLSLSFYLCFLFTHWKKYPQVFSFNHSFFFF